MLAPAATVLALTGAASASTPPIVRVYVAGSPEAVSGSRDAIQDLCSRSNVAVVVRDAAGADEALLGQSPAPGLAEAYVDLRPGSAPRVVVIDGETRKDLERRTLPENASLEISIETMAQVVCAAVESSLATRVPPPAPPPTPEKSAESATPARIELGSTWSSQLSLFAAASNFGDGFRGGAGAALGSSHGRGSLRWGVLLSVAGFPATDVESAGGIASFGSIGLHVLPTLDFRVAQWLTVFAGLGGGADWIRIAAEQPPPGAVGREAGSSFDAIACGMLGVRLHLGSGMAALFALDADADLSRHRYVIQAPQGNQTFFEPARLRPVALAGLSVSLGGGNDSSARSEARN